VSYAVKNFTKAKCITTVFWLDIWSVFRFCNIKPKHSKC